MPVCEGCGGSYENQFKFCPHCGRAKPEPLTLNINVTSDDVWETCEIYLVYDFAKQQNLLGNFLGGGKSKDWMFEATAIGTKGRYSVGQSEIFERFSNFAPFPEKSNDYHLLDRNTPVLHRDKVQSKLDVLIKKLVADGWQTVGRGQEWYSERFRRKVKK